jgi:hypothetical protein
MEKTRSNAGPKPDFATRCHRESSLRFHIQESLSFLCSESGNDNMSNSPPIRRWYQFSMRTLLLVMVVVAISLAALRSQSQLVGSVAYSLNLGLLCVGVVGSLRATPRWRVFWIGFAVFGWVYFWVATPQPNADAWLISSFGMQSPTNEPNPELITTTFLRVVDGFLASQPSTGDKVMAQWTGFAYYSGTITSVKDGQFLVAWDDGSLPLWRTINQISPNNYYAVQTGHYILGPIIALIGGWLSRLLFAPPLGTKREATGREGNDTDSDLANA